MKLTPGLIESMKANEKPFGLMSKEMQEAFELVGKSNIIYYCGGTSVWKAADLDILSFSDRTTYKLNSDYMPIEVNK